MGFRGDCKPRFGWHRRLCHWRFGNPLFSMGILMLNELEIDLIKQERDIMKAALKACRAECQRRGITSAEFAKMCGLSRVQLTVYTGAVPTTPPDFIETSNDDWMKHEGGECPTEVMEGSRGGKCVVIKFRDNGTEPTYSPHLWRWIHTNKLDDIVGYRIIGASH